MKKTRALALNRSIVPRAGMALLWLSLFAYAGRPLLVAARAEGLGSAAAWLALFLCSLLPMLPFFGGRDEAPGKRAFSHWIGYATMGVFSLLLVLVLLSDVLRVGSFLVHATLGSRAVAWSILGLTAGLSLVGLVQARCPRAKHVRIELDELPPELDGYRIVQWSDVHVGPTIGKRFACHPELPERSGGQRRTSQYPRTGSCAKRVRP
jgi:hypothetical protein